MARPTVTPRWANVSGDIVEPSSGRKDQGWVAGKRAPAQYFNWWQKLVYDWQQYFDGGGRAEYYRHWSAFAIHPDAGLTYGSGYVIIPATGFPWQIPLTVELGDRIRQFAVQYRRNSGGGGSSGDMVIRLRRIAAGTNTSIALYSDNSSSGWQTVGPALFDHQVVSGSSYWLEIDDPGTNPIDLAGGYLLIDRP